jgi:PAS domain S-box-containing protein
MSLTLLLALLLAVMTAVAGFLARYGRRRRAGEARLRAELEAARLQARQMLNVTGLAVAVLDEACHVLDWSPALERLYGCTRDSVLGQQFFLRLAPPAEGAALAARVMAMRGSDESLEFTFVLPPPAAPCLLRWRARHFTDGGDGRRYLSLVADDVTVQEHALQRLGASEARFRQMFEAMPVALALLDSAGHLLLINRECAHFFGYDAPEQMVAMSVQDLIHPDDRHASALALAALRARAEPLYQMETRYLRRDGVVRWGNARGVLVELAPGESCFLAQISDVHERKQTEQALLESERRLGTLIANLSGAVYRYELPAEPVALHHDLQPEFLSDGVESLTGLALPFFMRAGASQRLGALVAAEDRPRLVETLFRAMAGDGRFEVIYRLRHGAAGLRWIAEHGLAWRRPDGSWTVDGHLTDITAERQARQDEQLYRTLIAETRTGLVTLNASGRVLEVNEPFCAMLGVQRQEEVQGQDLGTLMPPGRDGVFRRFLSRVLRDGVLHDIEFTYPRRDGAQLNLVINAVAATGSGQALVKCLVLDISGARRAEMARRDSELRYRSLFETSINGVCFLSLDGDVEAVNPALRGLLGDPQDEAAAVRENFHDLLQPTDVRAQLLTRGRCDSFRRELVRADGSRLPVSVQAWLVCDEQQRPLRIMSVVRDVADIMRVEAERDALERSLRQALKMEAVGQLASGIVHDFNNILGSIIGPSEQALQHAAVERDPELGACLGEVRDAGVRAGDLIRQLQLFSRAGRGDSCVQPLAPLLQEALALLRPVLPASLQLHTGISPLLPAVRIDEAGLQQVLMNLLLNACEAGGPQGTVALTAHTVEGKGRRCASCHAALDGDHVEVAVSDRGPGFAEAIRERLFDPFFTTKVAGEGSGMGLAVVHGVVHELGGHVAVDRSGDTTTFRVLLPVADSERECIVVVDDDAVAARRLGEALARAGYRPVVFTESTRAAMLLEDIASPVAALVTRRSMPGLEGEELVQLAHRYRPALPVLVLGAEADATSRWPTLAEPVQEAELLALLQQLLQAPWQPEAQRRSGATADGKKT